MSITTATVIFKLAIGAAWEIGDALVWVGAHGIEDAADSVQLGVGEEAGLGAPEGSGGDGAGLPDGELGHDAEDADACEDEAGQPAAVLQVDEARHVRLGFRPLVLGQQQPQVLRNEGHARLLLQPAMHEKLRLESFTHRCNWCLRSVAAGSKQEIQRDVRVCGVGEIPAPEEAEEPTETERRQTSDVAVERPHRSALSRRFS